MLTYLLTYIDKWLPKDKVISLTFLVIPLHCMLLQIQRKIVPQFADWCKKSLDSNFWYYIFISHIEKPLGTTMTVISFWWRQLAIKSISSRILSLWNGPFPTTFSEYFSSIYLMENVQRKCWRWHKLKSWRNNYLSKGAVIAQWIRLCLSVLPRVRLLCTSTMLLSFIVKFVL